MLRTQLGYGVELVVAARGTADAVDAFVEAIDGAGGAVLDHLLKQEVGAVVLHTAVQLALVSHVGVNCGNSRKGGGGGGVVSMAAWTNRLISNLRPYLGTHLESGLMPGILKFLPFMS